MDLLHFLIELAVLILLDDLVHATVYILGAKHAVITGCFAQGVEIGTRIGNLRVQLVGFELSAM